MSASAGTPIFKVPANLLERYQRLRHEWDANQAAAVLRGYRQFMELKVQLQDWDATILSPPQEIDFMWHQHLLDVRNYVDSCQQYGGTIIGHNPDGGLDPVARAERIKTTLIAVKARFGSDYDSTIWSFTTDNHTADDDDNSNKRPRVSPNNDVMERRVRARSIDESSSDLITIYIRVVTSVELSEYWLRVKKTTKMGKVFAVVAEKKGMEVESFRFLLDGEYINGSDTPLDLELEDQCQIDCMLELCGC